MAALPFRCHGYCFLAGVTRLKSNLSFSAYIFVKDRYSLKCIQIKIAYQSSKTPSRHYLYLPAQTRCRCWKAFQYQTLRAAGWGCAGRHTLEGHSRGAFSGGEIQRLRRLRQEAHTPTVLVAVSDSFTAALPQSAQGVSPGASPARRPQSRPHSHTPLASQNHPHSHTPLASQNHPRSHTPPAIQNHPRSHTPPGYPKSSAQPIKYYIS